MRATSLAFLTPVWQRYSLTEVCLRQRRRVCDALKRDYGLDATCIVVGSDANLDVARDLGFEAVEHSNTWAYPWTNRGEPFVCLGMKFNASYVHARKLGIDLVFPIGSDSWIDPVYFDTLPEPGELLRSRAYNLVTADISRRGALWIEWEGGVQWISWTKDWGHRIGRDGYMEVVSRDLAKGCDTSTWEHKAPRLRLGEQHHHQLEYVAFQSASQQITDYAKIMARWGAGEVMGARVLGDLEAHYDRKDIMAVKRHYNAERRAVLAERLSLMDSERAETQALLDDLDREAEGLFA